MSEAQQVPSPLQPVEVIKGKILRHLSYLRLPVPVAHDHGKDCDRECHILERNYTIGVLEHFIQNL